MFFFTLLLFNPLSNTTAYNPLCAFLGLTCIMSCGTLDFNFYLEHRISQHILLPMHRRRFVHKNRSIYSLTIFDPPVNCFCCMHPGEQQASDLISQQQGEKCLVCFCVHTSICILYELDQR